MRDLYTRTLYKISSQDLYERSLYKSSLQDLFTGPPIWDISIQDLLISLDLLGLLAGALYVISSQDPRYETSLHKISWYAWTSGVSSQELSARSLHKTSIRDLYTRALYKISSQDPRYESSLYKSSLRSPDIPGPPRSLHRSPLQDLSTRPLWEISIQELSKTSWYPWTSKVSSQELSTRSLHKTSMRDLYTRALYKISSQDLYERPLYKRCLQDLFTQPPIWDISTQDLLISLDLLGLLAGDLYEISSRDHQMRHLYTRSPDIPGPPKSLHRSYLQDLVTRPLWEISIQELSTRSLHKTSIQELSLSLCKISSQDPVWDISIQDLRISLDLWDLLTTRSFQKTSFRIQHAESTERVARTKSKSAPRYSESDPTRTNPAEGCTSRNKKCLRLGASDIPSAKWARRYSHSDPTRTKSREGCICKHKIGAAPQRDSKNQSSDRTLTSELQYEMRFFDVLWRKYCACHEKMSPRHTKSCNCHAKWCQHSRSKFDDSFTKRAFRALRNRLQEHQILRLPRKMTIFHHLQFRATLTTILRTSQNPHVLHISRFPKIDTARRRERTSVKDLVGAPSRAGEMQIFDLDHNFSPRGSPKKPDPSAHTTDLHQMLFPYRKNPIVWPHCLGKKGAGTQQRNIRNDNIEFHWYFLELPFLTCIVV